MAKMTFLRKEPNLAAKTLRYWLHQHYTGYEPARPIKNVHASELTKEEGLCPRMYALSDVTKLKPKDRWLTTSERLTFQMGRDQERHVVEAFSEMNKAFCHWRCETCNHLHEFQSRPFKCQACGFAQFRPEEVRFESKFSGASCGIDMLVQLGEPKLRPVEIKTMASEQFKLLEAPLAEHRLRTTLYLRLIAECESPWAAMVNQEKATILYIAKNAYGVKDDTLEKDGTKDKFSPFKEFNVVRNDKLTDHLDLRAKVVKAFRGGAVGMPAGVCPSSLSKRAKGCALREHCFSGEYPPVYDWSGAV